MLIEIKLKKNLNIDKLTLKLKNKTAKKIARNKQKLIKMTKAHGKITKTETKFWNENWKYKNTINSKY